MQTAPWPRYAVSQIANLCQSARRRVSNIGNLRYGRSWPGMLL